MEASRSDTATFSIDDLLEHMVALGASDLHVTTGSAPVIRLNGRLVRIEDFPRLTPDDVHDSFNLWMATTIDETGRRRFRWNPARKGDVFDVVAMSLSSCSLICR